MEARIWSSGELPYDGNAHRLGLFDYCIGDPVPGARPARTARVTDTSLSRGSSDFRLGGWIEEATLYVKVLGAGPGAALSTLERERVLDRLERRTTVWLKRKMPTGGARGQAARLVALPLWFMRRAGSHFLKALPEPLRLEAGDRIGAAIWIDRRPLVVPETDAWIRMRLRLGGTQHAP